MENLTLTLLIMGCGIAYFYGGYVLGRNAGWKHGFESGILTEKNNSERGDSNEKN